ncbi:hypothetical protein [Photobacterium leiognathi]|uniref:hypothetical protein n=1 Tax=Photobacterium leiognathi TaxID=553611 RepID=UPI002739470F|nr:hypothetical protein [Photobacterium leiognathi]
MEGFYKYISNVNKNLDLAGFENVQTFMFAKNFIGIDLNFRGELIFVCKLPLHIIKTQSVNPCFQISGFYENDKLIALIIKVYDLVSSPYVIVSNFVTPLASELLRSGIQTLTFINEVNEPILDVKVTGVINNLQLTNPKLESILTKNELLQLTTKDNINCKTLCIAHKSSDVTYFIHRDSDQSPCHLHILSDDISKNGEDAVHGHGKRLEDLIHFKSLALIEAQSFFGLKYAIEQKKNLTPSEELCDELIMYGDVAVFIEAKSIITKQRFRETETLSDRISTTLTRINKAANQLSKNITRVKNQNNSIHTVIDNNTVNIKLPKLIMGLIVVSETFEGDVYNNGIQDVLASNPLFNEIQLNVISAEEFAWLITCSEGKADTFISLLQDRFSGFIKYGRYGSLPCKLSISCRLPSKKD